MVDTETGEHTERRLEREQARAFYSGYRSRLFQKARYVREGAATDCFASLTTNYTPRFLRPAARYVTGPRSRAHSSQRLKPMTRPKRHLTDCGEKTAYTSEDQLA